VVEPHTPELFAGGVEGGVDDQVGTARDRDAVLEVMLVGFSPFEGTWKFVEYVVILE